MKSPSFSFYPDDFFSGTAEMSQKEVGSYIRLLCHQWGRGSIPVEAEKVQRLAGGAVSDDVMSKFPVWPDGMRRNKRLEVERELQAEYRENQRKKGISSGVSRRSKAQEKVSRGLTAVQTECEPNLNNGSPPVGTGGEPEANFPVPCLLLPVPSSTEPPTPKGGNPPDRDPLPIPEILKTPAFIADWQRWMTYRRGMKRVKDWAAMFREQLEWLARNDAEKASEILKQSMRNGWLGLRELDPHRAATNHGNRATETNDYSSF